MPVSKTEAVGIAAAAAGVGAAVVWLAGHRAQEDQRDGAGALGAPSSQETSHVLTLPVAATPHPPKPVAVIVPTQPAVFDATFKFFTEGECHAHLLQSAGCPCKPVLSQVGGGKWTPLNGKWTPLVTHLHMPSLHSHIHTRTSTHSILFSRRAHAHTDAHLHTPSTHTTPSHYSGWPFHSLTSASTTPPFPLHASPLASSNGMGMIGPLHFSVLEIFPADAPREALIVGHGCRLRLQSRYRSPSRCPPFTVHSPHLIHLHSTVYSTVLYCTHSLLSIILAFPEWLNSERTSDPNYSSTTPSRTHVNSAALRRKQHRL
jgi:hypothetical protein